MSQNTSVPALIIVCGLPGSGKTTYARELEARLGALRFSPDEWMAALALDLYDGDSRAGIEAVQWKLTQELLIRGLTVIIEWGTWGRSERDALRLGTQALGAYAELHYLSAPLEVLFARIRRRAMEDPPVSWEDLVHWSEIFQPPTAEEGALFDAYICRASTCG